MPKFLFLLLILTQYYSLNVISFVSENKEDNRFLKLNSKDVKYTSKSLKIVFLGMKSPKTEVFKPLAFRQDPSAKLFNPLAFRKDPPSKLFHPLAIRQDRSSKLFCPLAFRQDPPAKLFHPPDRLVSPPRKTFYAPDRPVLLQIKIMRDLSKWNPK